MEERTDIGIISPYRAQVRYLRALLRRDSYLRPLLPAISVDTVDAFQGQERDMIIVSLVRANDEGQIGFLSDLRRMNVAITRARHRLVIIGSAGTLGRHKFYKALYGRCHPVCGGPLPPAPAAGAADGGQSCFSMRNHQQECGYGKEGVRGFMGHEKTSETHGQGMGKGI